MSDLIAVGIDGSPASQRALDYAIQEASGGGSLLLIRVIDWSPFVIESLRDNEYRGAIRKEQLDRAQNELIQPAVEKVRAANVPVEAEIVFGAPAEEINRLAEEHKAKALVIGRTGNSRIQEVLFGSKAARLIQMTDVPVIVVP